MDNKPLGRRLKDEEIDHEDFDGEIIYTDDGEAYEISDEYRQMQIEKGKVSKEKEARLQVAKELLDSNLKRLSPKQKEVMYYTMLGYHQDAIAKQLKINVRVVQEHLESAKKKLAKYIEGHVEIMKEVTDGTESTDSADNQG
jgi:DNA-binding CsgD family transcriptional regulator